MHSAYNYNVCLTDWSRATGKTKFTASAFHVCDFTADKLIKIKSPEKNLEAIIFVGSFQGEVIRWLVHENGASPYSTSYGHEYNTKIVQFEECTFPLVRNAIVSLSYDGSICVWSVLDGICLRHFPRILPKGCQRIACSSTAIEIAAVCGAFPNICIINIQDGNIVREIRPIPKSSVCLKFFSEGDVEWLFALGSNGCASYTTLTPKTASSHRFGIFSTEKNDVFIGAYPSPRFSFIILVYKKGYAIVALFSKNFPNYNNEQYPNIQSVVWLRENTYALIKYDGSFEIYSLEQPDPKIISPASVIKSIGYITETWIPSSVEFKTSAEILDCKFNIATLINPFVKLPFTREKIEQIPQETIKQYKADMSNDSSKSKSSRTQNNSKSTSVQVDFEYKVKPIFQLSGQSNIPLPLVSSFNEDIAFAFDDYIILANKNYEEFQLTLPIENHIDQKADENEKKHSEKKSDDGKKFKSHSKSKSSKNAETDQNTVEEQEKKAKKIDIDNYVTAQSYLIHNNTIKALIEGTNKGDITIQYMNNSKPILLKSIHRGRIVSMCTAGDFLFTSGQDCKLNVISLKGTNDKLEIYSNFVSPVTKFYFPCKPTHTSIDKCVFCATSDGIISVIDYSNSKTNNLFILTSHESPIEKIYFHPPTKLLLVQCRSLYFWSMITGNLESIMNGQQMYKYLNEMKDSLIEVTDEKSLIGTPKPCITRYGSFHLRATEINISQFSYKIGRHLSFYQNDTLKKAITSIDNLPFIFNLLPFKAANEINNLIRKDPSSTSNTDSSKKKKSKRIHKDMNFGFSGYDGVLTLNLEQINKKTEWRYSPQVSALLLSTRIALLTSLMNHSEISATSSSTWREILREIDPIFLKNPDLAYLIKVTLDLDAETHKYIFAGIQNYSKEQRQCWLDRLSIIQKNNVFPRYQSFFDLIFLIFKMTFYTELPDSELNEYAQYIYNYQNNPLNYRTDIAREIMGFLNSKDDKNQKKKKNLIEYYDDKNQKKSLVLNLFRFCKFFLPSTALEYFRNINVSFLSECSSFVRNNYKKNPRDCLKIIGNLAHVMKSARCEFADSCATTLGISTSYFLAGCSNGELLSKLSTILYDLSVSCAFFAIKSGKEYCLFAFGSSCGLLTIYKLKRIDINEQSKLEDCIDLFKQEAKPSENRITTATSSRNVPNSKSLSAMTHSSNSGGSNPSVNSPTSTSSSSFVARSKSFSTSAANNYNNDGNDGSSNKENQSLGKSVNTSNEEESSSAIGAIQSVVFGSIQVGKNAIHAVGVSPDDNAIFVGSQNVIYRVSITSDNSSLTTSPSNDEKSLKPKLKLAITSNKEIGEMGAFLWENYKLKYICEKSKFEITPSSEKL